MEEEEFVIEDEDDSIPKDDETSSVEDINGDRLQMLRNQNKDKNVNSEDGQSGNSNSSNKNDLDELHDKLQRRDDQAKRKLENQKKPTEKKKKTFVSIDYIRTIIIIELFRLYEQQKKIEDEQFIAETLSYLKFDILHLIEEKMKVENDLRKKLMILLMNFQLQFDQRYFSPELYIQHFAALCSLVKAIDIQFTGLEPKFKVKSLTQIDGDEDEPFDQNLNNLSKQIVDKTKHIFDQNIKISEEMPSDLLQFEYKSQRPFQQIGFLSQKFSSEADKSNISIKLKKQRDLKLNSRKFNEELWKKNQNLWLEVFDKVQQKWLTLDPISDINLTLDINKFKIKVHNTCSMYIITTQQIYFRDPFYEDLITKDRIFGNFYFYDLTWKYCLKFKHVRLQLLQERWFNELAASQSNPNYNTILDLLYNGKTNLLHNANKDLVESDRNQYSEWCLENLPLNEKEIRYHPILVLKSGLSQYQMIRPNAKPIENITFNGEYAYLKADITVLHSRDKWRTYLREVKKEEIENPIKEITGKFKKNNGTPTSVYAEWQTLPLKISASEELPKNDYNNYEVFSHPPPRGTVVFRKMGIKNILQKNSIRFVEAVDGFDMKSSKFFAAKCGYLIYAEDEEKVQQLYDEYKICQVERMRVNKKKELKGLWTQLFKAILVKKQIQDKYQS